MATDALNISNDRVIGPLCEYIAAVQDRELRDDVVIKAKCHILDTMAAMVSGSTLIPGRLIASYVQAQGGAPESCIVGNSLVTTAVNAALANGIMAHADETDDSHAPSMTHPGCAVVPAALAMAEREGRGGESFLRAVVLGYDVGCRVSRALVPRLFRPKGHCSHSIGGTFGAAVAAASLGKLDPIRIRYVLSYAAQQASGVRAYFRSEDHVEKAFVFGGMPARGGVTAATLAQAGFTAVADIFQGEHNFLNALSPHPKPEELVDGLGVRYEIMETNIKKYYVGSPIQAALEAMVQLMREHRVRAEEVLEIVAWLPEKEAITVNDRHMPDINLQYILSVALLDGGLSFEAAHSYERMREQSVLELKARIKLRSDPELTQAYPPRQAVVEIMTRDGRCLRRHVVNVQGTAGDPMNLREVRQKAEALLRPVIGKLACEQLIEKVEGIEHVTDMRELRGLLAGQ